MTASAFLPFHLTLEKLQSIRLGPSSLLDWLYALAALLLVWVVTRSIHAVVQSRLRKVAAGTSTPLDDVAHEVALGTYWFLHAGISLEVAQSFADFGAAAPYVHGVTMLFFFTQLGVWAQRAITGLVRVWADRNEGAHNVTLAAGIRFVARLGIWVIVGLLVLSNWGVQIEAVVAGLGVGGIAAALALQGILGDLFAGLSMYFDRPFDIGDSIAVDPLRGTVVKIGLRTTRILSLDGEEIIVPNGDLVKSRIKNFARMKERRVVLAIGLEYGLTPERLEQARGIVKDVLAGESQVTLGRAHFKGFGPASLDFEFVYHVLSPEYVVYMDVQERINLAIYREFAMQGLSFAFPTQTLHVANLDATLQPLQGGAGAPAGGPVGNAPVAAKPPSRG